MLCKVDLIRIQVKITSKTVNLRWAFANDKWIIKWI